MTTPEEVRKYITLTITSLMMVVVGVVAVNIAYSMGEFVTQSVLNTTGTQTTLVSPSSLSFVGTALLIVGTVILVINVTLMIRALLSITKAAETA